MTLYLSYIVRVLIRHAVDYIEISRKYKGITKNAWLKRKRKSYKSQLHHSEIKMTRAGALRVKFYFLAELSLSKITLPFF